MTWKYFYTTKNMDFEIVRVKSWNQIGNLSTFLKSSWWHFFYQNQVYLQENYEKLIYFQREKNPLFFFNFKNN